MMSHLLLKFQSSLTGLLLGSEPPAAPQHSSDFSPMIKKTSWSASKSGFHPVFHFSCPSLSRWGSREDAWLLGRLLVLMMGGDGRELMNDCSCMLGLGLGVRG